MSTHYGFLAKNISWLMLGRISAKVCSLLALPIITAYLKPEAYGIIALFFVEASFLAGIYGLGLSSFAGRMIYKYERTIPKKCHQYLGVTLFYMLIFGLLGVMLSIPFVHALKKLILKDVYFPNQFLLYVPVIYAFFLSLYGFTTNSFLNLQQNKKLFICEICEFLIVLPLQIIGLIWYGFTWVEVVLLQLIGKVITTLVALWMLRTNLSFSFKRLKIIPQALRFSLPFVPLNFSGWIQQQIDKVFLGNMVSAGSVGVYAIGAKMSESFSFFSRPMMTTIKPEISKRLDSREENIQKDITDFFNLFFQVALFLIFFVSIFSKEIISLFVEKSYLQAYMVLPFLMFAYLFTELSGVFHLKIFYKNKTMIFPFITIGGALINAGLNYWLIPRFKIMGAAFATVIANVFLLFVSYVVSQRLDFSRYHLIRNFTVLAMVVAAIFFIGKFWVISTMTIAIKIVLSVIYGIILWRYLIRTNERFRGAKEAFWAAFSARFA